MYYCILFVKDSAYIRPTRVQTARAANAICAAFKYRIEVDHENFRPVSFIRIYQAYLVNSLLELDSLEYVLCILF